MNYGSIYPYFGGSILIFFFVGTPLFRYADAPPTRVPGRFETIDGLRGFLALGVFFHHAATYHLYLLNGVWTVPAVRFYANLGPVGVAVFFMITGYLFWGKMLKEEGKPDFLNLYVGRCFRIVPLYLVLVVLIMLMVGITTRGRLEAPLSDIAKAAARWLAGGMLLGGDVNGVSTAAFSAGVTWSLQYEWLFYASLFVISLLARRRLSRALFPTIGTIVIISILIWRPAHISIACALMFLCGMTAASFKITLVAPSKAIQLVLSTVVIASFVFTLVGCTYIFRPLPILALGFAFWLIANGTTIYGLLLTRQAARLGDISYGIYLLQGPILFVAFEPPLVRSLVIASPWIYWAVALITAGALVLLATACHVLIERPGVEVGRRVCAALASRRRPADQALFPTAYRVAARPVTAATNSSATTDKLG